jgi:hypothetical protein
MGKDLTITDELYKRLEALANGFDTPTDVIERLLDNYENQGIQQIKIDPAKVIAPRSFQLDVKFIPSNEEVFKQHLIKNKTAWIKLYRVDGSEETKMWRAQSFTHKSDLMGNLRSGYLRGWKEKGICKAVLAIESGDLPS